MNDFGPARRGSGGHAGFNVVKSLREVQATDKAVFEIREAFGVEHATFHMARSIAGYHDIPYVKSTYPAEWLTRYLLQGYSAIDPVVLEGFNRSVPFFWEDLEYSSVQSEFFEDAEKHGIGQNGYTVPIVDKSGRRSLFSLSSSEPSDAWHVFIERQGTRIVDTAHELHQLAVEEIYGQGFFPHLSAREVECLSWTAQGKDSPSIAVILGLSDHTVRAYLRSVRYKLCCSTLSQAVAKAIQLRIIMP